MGKSTQNNKKITPVFGANFLNIHVLFYLDQSQNDGLQGLQGDGVNGIVHKTKNRLGQGFQGIAWHHKVKLPQDPFLFGVLNGGFGLGLEVSRKIGQILPSRAFGIHDNVLFTQREDVVRLPSEGKFLDHRQGITVGNLTNFVTNILLVGLPSLSKALLLAFQFLLTRLMFLEAFFGQAFLELRQ